MPKKEEYTPSPWLEHHKKELQMARAQVRLPPAVVNALYQLQRDRQEVEYGGAMDFELIEGRPAVERVLAYTGLVRLIPWETWNKVFLNPDIELTFHTHPGQNLAIPGEGDIIFFLTTEPSAMLIFASDEAILMTKGKETPPADYVREHMGEYEATALRTAAGRVLSKEKQDQMRQELKKEIDIDTVVFHATQPVDITLQIVHNVAREGQRLKMFP